MRHPPVRRRRCRQPKPWLLFENPQPNVYGVDIGMELYRYLLGDTLGERGVGTKKPDL